jgi:acetylornithine/succinyldiaminopimelate/putrescine aminotransferase
VVPDIMTVAKALGGGIFPNAAILFRGVEPLTRFVSDHPDFHPTSTGGSDLGCRVSLAVLRYLRQHRLWENAERQGDRLRAALEQLRADNPRIIKEVRGLGLMVGLEYLHEFMGPLMSDALAKRGVFAAYSGNAPQVMRFMTPITVSDAELDQLIAAIAGAVADMKRILPLALAAARIPPVLRLLNRSDVQTRLFGALRRIEDLGGRLRDRFGARPGGAR